MQVTVSAEHPSQLVSVVFYYAQRATSIKLINGNVEESTLKIPNGEPIVGDSNIASYLCSTLNLPIYPEAHRAEIDQYLSDYPSYQIGIINNLLTYRSFLVGDVFTVADIAVYSCLPATIPQGLFRLKRWANFISIQDTIKRFKASSAPKKGNANQKKKGNANLQNVCTRFAPEPSGYLHIGHAKAALASEQFARDHNGTFVLRFDDTNPRNESKEFEEKILADVALLDLHPDRIERTSDFIPKIFEIIKKMFEDGLAFVDDTPVEKIQELRSALQPSPNRDNTPERNLELWEEMLKGTEKGKSCVARAKIDYKNTNGCLRDPVIARCIIVEGQENKCPVYPTYDIACPIVDSTVGITHAMRSWEYTDRDHQYRWFIKNLKLRPVEIVSFSRLSFNRTVLGKRYLRRLVQEGKASGWDDPRFPTVRGLRRRGLQPSTIRQFCKDQGASCNQNVHDWDKIWAMNRDIISKTCPRVMSVSVEEKVEMRINGAKEGEVDAPILPTDPSKGTRKLPIAPVVYTTQFDAKSIKVGEKVTLLHWGNVIIDKIEMDGENVKLVEAHLVEDKNYKGTLKINWIVPEKAVTIIMREWNHLLKVNQLSEGVDVIDALSDVPYADTEIMCDASIKDAQKGQIFQLERRGEIIVDEPGEKAMTFYIPTGKVAPISLPIKIQLFGDNKQ
ncbi:glutamyl-tRNA synthetase [Histomonas meleagridis]|uniref:glutamyl-tRNA synthetase n=1 Tax=Histomonas meleagridis TaxID=135588 RepID=UPI003559601E|nr:glutamyl-tRNA synthetase [Histomonas meleagridis]KAH0806347.1 glutamyl-tRNA synthetase [Histomonas meleagridis]